MPPRSTCTSANFPAGRLEDERPRPHARVDARGSRRSLRVQAGVGVGDDLEAEVGAFSGLAMPERAV
jgi:hypothetical protein